MAGKDTTTAAADLSRLSQQQAGWWIGKPPSWLRENSHLFRRNADGTYDGRHLFTVVSQLWGLEDVPFFVLDLVEKVLYGKEVIITMTPAEQKAISHAVQEYMKSQGIK